MPNMTCCYSKFKWLQSKLSLVGDAPYHVAAAAAYNTAARLERKADRLFANTEDLNGAWEGSNLGKDRCRRLCKRPYAFRLLWRRRTTVSEIGAERSEYFSL
jgi:hypothetical protein